MRSSSRFAPWVATALLTVMSVLSYASLPERVPTRFGFDGTVTSTASRSLGEWMLMSIIAAVTVLLMQRLGGTLPDNPSRFNYPRKDDLLALPQEFQAPVVAEMQWFLDWMAFGTVCILLGVQCLRWHVATGGDARVGNYVLMAILVLSLPAILVLLGRVNRATDDAMERYRASTMGRASSNAMSS